ncbi:ammonium transporter [Microcystis aeruginosa]|uniref:ammonium transporter n=1 Tax=Microcystis aeruginosa TaxID=1126 RepID=UPI00232B6E12|nr:ammonium transporter [Microcystis aeruginosa]MDB9432391.1 ammonium transporter [Microcystis aeruginosa CS-552/01]
MNRLLSFLEYRPRLRNILSFCFSVIVMLLIGVGKVTAQDLNNSTLDLVANIWMLTAGSLVFFMNAGFAMLETGFCRTNNATNVLAKNLIVFCVSALAYWMFGFGLMFGNTSALGNSFSGGTGFFLEILTPNNEYSQFQKLWPGRSIATLFFFQLTFAGTAATIVSGAVAERVKFWAFLLFSFFLVAFSYSLTGHWIWSSEGWLYNLFKFRDFAGSTVVHSVGGMAGLVGAWLLKPRDGRFGYNRKTDRYEEKERGNFAPHQLGFATLGCFILWLGWFGFNGGSAVNLNDVPMTITTTMIAAATGGFLALIFNPLIGRKVSLSIIINGILGGLVGITASSGYVNIKSAIIIGGISGIIVLLGEEFLVKTKVIDDPVGVISVHLFCGFWGTMAVGFFSTKDAGEFALGLTQNSRISQVAFQFFGWVIVMAFTFIFSLILWLMIGNLLYYMQVIVLRQKNPQVNFSPVVRSQSFNVSDLFSLFWSRGREGIRVSLSDELTGSDGVFSD